MHPPHKKPWDVNNSPQTIPKKCVPLARLKVYITWGQCCHCGDFECTGVQKWLFMAINPPTAPLARTESTKHLLASDNAHLWRCKLREAIALKKQNFMKKIHKPGGRVCRFSQNLIFSSKNGKNGKKNGPIKIRLHQTPTGRAGQHFMNFFHKIPFF